MITIAVTGGIGAGKSETIHILGRFGANIVNADLLGHSAYARGTAGYAEVIDAFGTQIVGADSEIDRAKVGAIVFADASKRRLLEAIVWHRIRKMLEKTLSSNVAAHVDVTAIEAAVLYEAGWEDLADRVWTVEASYHHRLARIIEKTGMSEVAVRARMDAQLSPEDRIARANAVICNDGGLNALECRVAELWRLTTKS